MEPINLPERDLSKIFGIPLETLRRDRKNKLFSKAICFRYKNNSRILYNVKNFSVWFEQYGKISPEQELNKYLKEYNHKNKSRRKKTLSTKNKRKKI